MLLKYAPDQKVMSISATNLMADKMPRIKESYLFSNYGGNWGWASWQRAWSAYDYDLTAWSKRSTHLRFLRRFGYSRYLFFDSIFKVVSGGNRKDIWDYQWWFHILNRGGLTIVPATNLLQNIGFGDDATHTTSAIDPMLNVPIMPLAGPIIHPRSVRVHTRYEKGIVENFYSLRLSAWQKIRRSKQVFKRLMADKPA